MTSPNEYISRLASTVCQAPRCNEERLQLSKRRYSRYCAKHDAERRQTTCTLGELWTRWLPRYDGSEPLVLNARIGGKTVWGLSPAGMNRYRVTLQGAAESVVMRADTVVELGKTSTSPEAKEAYSSHSAAYQTTCKTCGAPRDESSNLALCHEHLLAYRREQRRQTARNKQAAP